MCNKQLSVMLYLIELQKQQLSSLQNNERLGDIRISEKWRLEWGLPVIMNYLFKVEIEI